FAEVWTRDRWRPTTPVRILGSSSFTAITCSSSRACLAVGDSGIGGILETWDGLHWRLSSRLKAPSAVVGLRGISCRESVCVAAGWEPRRQGSQALAATWNGDSWTLLRLNTRAKNSPKGLSAVSCPSTQACMAVGDLGVGLASFGQPAVAGIFPLDAD